MPDPKTYTIAGKSYRYADISYQQGEWLRLEKIFDGVNLAQAEGTELQQVLRTRGPLLLAICLLEEGQSKEQKIEAGFEAVLALERAIRCSLKPSEVMAIGLDFFTRIPFEDMWQFIDFRPLLPHLTNKETGSPPAAASSPAATSPAATSS